MSDQPPTNFFAGKWQKALQREETREAIAAAGDRPSALKHDFIVPPGSDITEGAIKASIPRAPVRLPENYTPDGTYIPLSGGLRGWFENSGVMNHEAQNRYRFHEAVDAEAFKTTILERIGSQNRREVSRRKVDLWTRHGHPESEEAQEPSYCCDLSTEGARLRIRHEMQVDDPIAVAFYRTRKQMLDGAPLVRTLGLVSNFRRANPNQENARYYVGIRFTDLEIGAKEQIARLALEGEPLPEPGAGTGAAY